MKPIKPNSKLVKAAIKAQKMAYAPYSKFLVGAAILDSKNKIYSGCNVENSSYGATVCAERNAIGSMITNGGKEIKEIVVTTKKGWSPCGICRQVLNEFATNGTIVHIFQTNKHVCSYFLSDLLPNDFSPKDL